MSRYRFARWLDSRFPRACWVNLYDWSDRKPDLSLRDALRPDPMCLRDIADNGSCWCGKNRPAPCGQPQSPARLTGRSDSGASR